MKNYEVIYQAIERGILKEVYEAGSYLPSENKLRQTYHVSGYDSQSVVAFNGEWLHSKNSRQGLPCLKARAIAFPCIRFD